MAELSRLRDALCALSAPTHTAAVLVPLIKRQGEWQVLFEVRSLTVRQPGEICFPGGRAEPGETPEQTALRETAEELGIAQKDISVLSRLSAETHALGRNIQPVVAELSPDALEALHLEEREVSAVFTVPVRWFLQTPPKRLQYSLLPQKDVSLPPILQGYLAHYSRPAETLYWEYDGHGIWGMTARILQNLLTVWKASGISTDAS